MHESMKRLWEAARSVDAKKRVTTFQELGKALKASPATITNWKARGVSRDGAIQAESVIGVDATWIMTGLGAAFGNVEAAQKSKVVFQLPAPATPTTEQTLERLGEMLRELAPDRREAVAGLFASWVREGGAALYPALIAPLLAPVHGAEASAQPDKRAA